MEIGMKLRSLKEKKKMTNYRLTQMTGISGQHIRGIEEGTRQPTLETLSRLTAALGTSLSELFNEDTECSYLNEKERKIVEYVRMMSEEKSDALLNLIETWYR
ncbi:helix-turn-helix domain-containing protein [Ruminococcus albus]|uniref:helix-turn-helix domain-containing protein n=1 Tax=Ruminococcus albus TaxID=1264 RepID=UPI0004675482|nr:helix-turn-helix transcriptional regulator [Ruminococcus albus]